MNEPRLPAHEKLTRRWQLERVARLARYWFGVILGGAFLAALSFLIFQVSQAGVLTIFSIVAALWVIGGLSLFVISRRRPSPHVLARRADGVLKLPDDLLSLSELPPEGDAWREAGWTRTKDYLENCDLRKAWPVTISRATVGTGLAALALTLVVVGLGWKERSEANLRMAAVVAAQEKRLADSKEVLDDWKQFIELTDDPELKKLFTQAAELQKAMESRDPKDAMLEMNRIEEQMSSMDAAISEQSMSSQAAQLAEAFEAFEGMGAMSAALRNQNFAEASKLAEKLKAELDRNPDGTSELRRDAAVAEMLSTQAKNASQRGNSSLSNALQQMSQAAAAGKGSVPNKALSPPTKALSNEFAQEAIRKNRGKAALLAKQQLDVLRRRMRGEQYESCMSLCKACTSPGKNPGTSPGGDPKGNETELVKAGLEESVTGIAGEGESETRTISAATGSGSSTGGSRASEFSDYVELSQQAVEDENLPLAHRRVIRSYFERIRPVADPKNP